jgi:hypothetical protein
MKITLIFMFYSNLDVNRTVENELETNIDLKPLGPPPIPLNQSHSLYPIFQFLTSSSCWSFCIGEYLSLIVPNQLNIHVNDNFNRKINKN